MYVFIVCGVTTAYRFPDETGSVFDATVVIGVGNISVTLQDSVLLVEPLPSNEICTGT